MKLSKKDIKLLILYTVLLVFSFVYIKYLYVGLRYVIKIFMPFIIGLMIAFVLNVLVCVIENKWFKRLKWSSSVKRGISLTISILLVIGFFILLIT